MKRIASAVLLAASLLPPQLLAADGVVVFIQRGCDRFIAETLMGYALLQWFGGSTPNRGDRIVGDYEAYGVQRIFNVTQNTETSVWVDDFYLSKSRVIDKYRDKCD